MWVGFPTEEVSIMTPPATRITVYGGTWPAQIWKEVMDAGLAGKPPTGFTAPTSTTAPPVPAGKTAPTTTPLGAPAAVPSVVGLSYADALDKLASKGFRATKVEVADTGSPPGTVTRQSPAPGAMLATGAPVTVQVAKGAAAPDGTSGVPDVVGQKVDDATATLQAAGFVVTAHVAAAGGDGHDGHSGRVWQQSPAAGTDAAAGSTVDLQVNLVRTATWQMATLGQHACLVNWPKNKVVAAAIVVSLVVGGGVWILRPNSSPTPSPPTL